MSSPTRTLARFIVETDYSDLPNAVVKKAKQCILDSVGCALGGYASSPGRNIAKMMASLGGRPDATIIGEGMKVALPNAALANAYLANILDFDDTYRGHPGCTVCPAALGGGETINASGKDVLAALVVGYEISARIARAVHYKRDTTNRIRGITHQTLGAVSSASKALSLEFDQALSALGIAGSTTPVQSNAKTSGEENLPPTMKIGFYACSMVGVMSALLARNGVTGPDNIFDGDTGFWRMIGADDCDFQHMTSGLGTSYEILNVAFKPYSCCRWFHSSLDAVLDIVDENNIETKNIKSIHVSTVAAKQNVGYLANPRPANFVAAVFSLPYSIAVALSGVEPGPSWISDDRLHDKGILNLASKVTCTFEEKTESELADDIHRWPATVYIIAQGKRYSKRVEYPRGSPENMLSDSEIDAKFMQLAENVLGQDRAAKAKTLVFGLDSVKDINDLTSMLGPSE